MDRGIINDDRTYTVQSLAELLGFRQSRSLERLLQEINCPVMRLGKKKLVSGRQFRLAVEGKGCLKTSPAGH
jgi:hypothetical protein